MSLLIIIYTKKLFNSSNIQHSKQIMNQLSDIQIEGLILEDLKQEELEQAIYIEGKQDNSDSNDSDDELKNETLGILNYPGFLNENEKLFGLDLDIFGRFPPKKLPKKTYKPIYHYHNNCNIDYRNIWLDLNINKLICKHINKEYSILKDINGKYTLKIRRQIWPFSLKNYSINSLFEYNLFDMKKYFRWIIILNHGGKFGISLFHGNEIIKHKIIKKYVCRKKQGKRQANFMNQNTKYQHKSCGSFKRASQEKNLLKQTQRIISNWQNDIQNACNKIFIFAPSDINQNPIFGNKDEQMYLYPEINGQLNYDLSKKRLKQIKINNENKAVNLYRIYKKDNRIENIPFTTYQITLQEIKRIHYMLATCWLSVKQ